MLVLIILAARLAPVPALSDPVNGPVPESLHLSVPALYLVFAPVFTLWDGISMLSITRLRGFLIGLAGAYVLWRIGRGLWARYRGSRVSWLKEAGVLLLTITLLLVFLVVGALWHRPMLSLAGVPAGYTVVDFHTHTNRSHDVQGTWMQGFDREANRRWHRRAGFDAVFLTDHNLDAGPPDNRGSPVLCPGIEVSAWRAHIVLLGDSLPVDRGPYSRDLTGLLTLLRTSESAYGALSLASLPEYQRNHWTRLDQLVAAGLDGFEIVNAAPKANELRRDQRDSVIALARARNLFLVGVSDSHGWGATSMVWNLVQAPSRPRDICAAVLGELDHGFRAVRIVERHRLRPDDSWPEWLTPLGLLWETWRSMGWDLTASWLLWIGVWAGLSLRKRRTC